MFLYHMVIHNDFDVNISLQRVLKEGLNHHTATRWYSKGANFFPELTERFRPVNSPKWIDFKVAFRADLEPFEKPYFRFPVFSDKILVFNFDISSVFYMLFNFRSSLVVYKVILKGFLQCYRIINLNNKRGKTMEEAKEYDVSKFKRLLLLFPPLYLIHDFEEIITVEKFLEENSHIITFSVTTLEFSFAFTLLWILASIGCFMASLGKRFIGMKPTTYLSFLVPGILFANGIGHFLQFVFFKDYVPGIITSIGILYPYSFFTAKFLIAERVITKKRLLSYLLLGFVVQAPLALMALYISKLIF